MKLPFKKRYALLALFCAVLLFLFCPRKLSWLIPSDSIIGYYYKLSYYEDETYTEDVAPLLEALDNTYVVWTGWTHCVMGPGNDIFVRVCTENRYVGTFYALGNSKNIYYKDMGPLQRYYSFGGSLLELLEQSGVPKGHGDGSSVPPTNAPDNLPPSP
ncbi:hypothetical protein [Candidatus Pseudoscillospira sp. SGI.172]|uniref:hypothetical protein n=1 Tax=Candidatus Pseudoscillospira sp. SGI.172 TaxID=3420582 RepID=UPI002A770EB1|nr:hypothetical protein [Pseudoflavonifractor sp.]MDY3019331.1 hypothetical protein [Oscillospiraceae bacterium]